MELMSLYVLLSHGCQILSNRTVKKFFLKTSKIFERPKQDLNFI